jgi:hypothetical protein
MNSAGSNALLMKASTIYDLRFTSALDFGARLQGFNARTFGQRILSLTHSVALMWALVVPNSLIAATQGETATKPILAPESQQESDWVDARWNQTDVGPFLASNLSLPARIAKEPSATTRRTRPGAAHGSAVSSALMPPVMDCSARPPAQAS